MRVAIFIDGANLYFTQKRHLNWTIDLKKFIQYFEDRGAQVVEATYYTSYSPVNESQAKFMQSLPYMGYSVVSKPLKEIISGDEILKKGNMDVEIATDMFNSIDRYDCAILFSGDSDFERVLNLLRARGKTFYVISHPEALSKELYAISGRNFINIADMERFITYQPRQTYPYRSTSRDMLAPAISQGHNR